MALGDAAARRQARDVAAFAGQAAGAARDRQPELQYAAAVGRFSPLIARLHRVAVRYARPYMRTYRRAHDWRLDRGTRHEVAPGIAALLFGEIGDGNVMLELSANGVVADQPALLLLSLKDASWRIRVGERSLSEYAPPGAYNYNTVLSSNAQVLNTTARPDEYSSPPDQYPNPVHYWARVDDDEVYRAVEELITVFLDQYNIPYSEVEAS